MKTNETYYKVTRIYRNEKGNTKLVVEVNNEEEAEELFERFYSGTMYKVGQAEINKREFEYSLSLSKCFKFELRQQVLRIRTSNPDNTILGIT